MSSVHIIGVGSPHGDDWLGWELAERLRASTRLAEWRDQVSISLHDRPGGALLQIFQSGGPVILLDAVRSGGKPGTVHRFDTRQLSANPDILPSEGFGVAEAVQLAASLDALPASLQFFGVEIDPDNSELRLSDTVHSVLPGLVEEIEQFVLAQLRSLQTG